MKVYFLHGMGGSPADWEGVLPLAPGETLSMPAGLSFEATAQLLADQIRAEIPFVICGYSMGGRLAMRMASLLAGSGLRGLILLAAGLGFPDEKSRNERKLIDDKWAELTLDKKIFWEKWYHQELFATFHELSGEKQSAWLERRFSIDSEGLSHQLRALSPACHPFLLPDLENAQKNGISVLYIAGERDKKYKNLAMELKQRGVETAIFPGGHILPLETPKAVALAIRGFTQRLEEER